MITNCDMCGIPYVPNKTIFYRTTHHYCSRGCYNKTRIPVSKECQECGQKYTLTKEHTSRRWCENCISNTNRRKAIDKVTVGEIKAKHHGDVKMKATTIRSDARARNVKILSDKCWNKNCNYQGDTELCHIKSVRMFDASATLCEINSPTNVVILCRNCHWEFDNGHLLLTDIETARQFETTAHCLAGAPSTFECLS